MATIRKGFDREITTNFREKEFYSTSWGKGYTDLPDMFDLSDTIINALQFLREEYGVPIYINSTLRSKKHNTAIKGASQSWHLGRYNGTLTPVNGVVPMCHAVDWRFKDEDKEGSAGYKAKQDLYSRLASPDWKNDVLIVSLGVNGVGLYDTFTHFDSRSGIPVKWDMRSEKKNPITAVQEAFSGEQEDGIEPLKPRAKKWALWAIVVTLVIGAIITGLVIYKSKK